MIIEQLNLPHPVSIKDIENGDVFKYGFSFYMKVAAQEGLSYNAVTFTGSLVDISDDLPITPVKAKVVVE